MKAAHQKVLARIMVVVCGLMLCGLPEFAQAQQAGSPQNNQGQQNGTTVDPSQGPLQPVPSDSTQSNQNTEVPPAPLPATPVPQPRPEQQMQQPLGAATAEGVPTVGGGASRPAGEAIAPDKQKQRHSLLLKMGLIAAVGVAGGAVYGLSKGTPSRPGSAQLHQAR
ncbi:MAG: hypothetical protein WA655_06340 [Candidatus Korobacteraceae bacterium]